jgi:zinc/manganese transport system substrate-binding protein/manganese/iron transport system substrate-binding protein
VTRAAVALCVFALAAAGCGGGGAAARDGRPVVVATTTQLADLARNVAGGRAQVVGLLAPNTDPHSYEVRPRDVKALERATLVLRSGGDVDGWLHGAIDASGTRAPVLTALDRVPEDGADPHWWQDPGDAERVVAAIRDAFSRADPAGAALYRANAARYEARLRGLDRAVAGCLDRVPPGRRTLVTTHDAFGYYARRYGIRIVGTVIPSLSTEAQPSAGATARLIATIRRTGVRAVFAENSVNPKLADVIAGETGARVGSDLWGDSLGPAGSDGATYLGAIAANTDAIARGLGVRCSL